MTVAMFQDDIVIRRRGKIAVISILGMNTQRAAASLDIASTFFDVTRAEPLVGKIYNTLVGHAPFPPIGPHRRRRIGPRDR